MKRSKDLQWIRDKSSGFAVGLQERTELAMIAIQGPDTFKKLSSILSSAQIDAISTLTPFECVDIDNWFFARTGYTGEDGLEIIMPATEISNFWNNLLKIGIQPCGLGARDTLRLEAGMLLYGQDMDENTNPLESGLTWTIKWEPEDRNFIGMGALLSQKELGIKYKMVGLILKDKGIMRPQQKVILSDNQIGVITSGSYSPTMQCSIALARIPITDKNDITNQTVMVDIRGKLLPATTTVPRFVKNGKII